MILDNAAELVAEHGVSSVTMERISKRAGSSKSLIYKYFTTPVEILRELLTRELRELRRLQFNAAERANTFEELVRNVTHEYLTYIDTRGLIIERLQADPTISDTGALIDYGPLRLCRLSHTDCVEALQYAGGAGARGHRHLFSACPPQLENICCAKKPI